MMGTREPFRGGDEYDALMKRGRRSLMVFRHASIAARTKRRFWKGVRKEASLNARVDHGTRLAMLPLIEA